MIYKRLSKDEIKNIPRSLLLQADPSDKSIDTYIHRAYGIGYFDDQLVGVSLYIETRPNCMEIINVSVDPAYQGQGIGKQLVLETIKQIKSLNVKTIDIGTGNSSVSQLALYQKCGFQIVAIDKDYFVKHYDEPLYENGIHCRDMIRLKIDL